MKFVDNTEVVGLIPGGDETNYRNEVNRLNVWYSVNHQLNTTKSKDLILDFRKGGADATPSKSKVSAWKGSTPQDSQVCRSLLDCKNQNGGEGGSAAAPRPE